MHPTKAGAALVATLIGFNVHAAAQAPAAKAMPTAAPTAAQAATPGQRLLAPAPIPPLQATVSYAKIEVVLGESLAVARGGLVNLGVTYTPAPVASVQVPGALSYPIGPFPGGFQHTVANADIRALLRRDEAQILERCRASLDYNKRDVLDTVHDTTIPLTVNGPDGAVIASTSVAYQLGLTCKRPLIVKVPYAKIEVDINRPLAQARGGQVALTFSYSGTRSVSSLQFGGGAFSYPLGTRQGPFDQTLPNADIRLVLAYDEAAIQARCRQTLEYNNLSVADTVHDASVPFTVNAADGAVVASATVPYQLGLTCRR